VIYARGGMFAGNKNSKILARVLMVWG